MYSILFILKFTLFLLFVFSCIFSQYCNWSLSIFVCICLYYSVCVCVFAKEREIYCSVLYFKVFSFVTWRKKRRKEEMKWPFKSQKAKIMSENWFGLIESISAFLDIAEKWSSTKKIGRQKRFTRKKNLMSINCPFLFTIAENGGLSGNGKSIILLKWSKFIRYFFIFVCYNPFFFICIKSNLRFCICKRKNKKKTKAKTKVF